MSNLIPLQTAYIRQSMDVKDNAWVVFDTSDNELYELPNHLSAKVAMGAVHLGRKFELEAFNIGIDFGKSEMRKIFDVEMKHMEAKCQALEEMNVRLGTQLEKFIIGDGET